MDSALKLVDVFFCVYIIFLETYVKYGIIFGGIKEIMYICLINRHRDFML